LVLSRLFYASFATVSWPNNQTDGKETVEKQQRNGKEMAKKQQRNSREAAEKWQRISKE